MKRIIIDIEDNGGATLMVIDSDNVEATTVRKLSEEEAVATLATLVNPVVELKQKTIKAYLEYHAHDMAVYCVVQVNDEDDPLRLRALVEPGSSKLHNLVSAMQDSWHTPVEVSNILEEHYAPSIFDVTQVVYTLPFNLPNGMFLRVRFVKDDRYGERF